MATPATADALPIAPGENRVAFQGMDWVAYQQMKALLNPTTGMNYALIQPNTSG